MLVAVFVAGFAGYGVFAFRSLRPDVNESHYADVVVGKDVLADILPPPLYILESFLVAHQIGSSQKDSERADLVQRLNSLRKDFETRITYWDDNLNEGKLKNSLQGDARSTAQRFFELLDKEFIPAARTSDSPTIARLLSEDLAHAYADHRAAIDAAVAAANDFSSASVADAAEKIRNEQLTLLMLGGIVLAFGLGFGVYVSKGVSTPLAHTMEVLEKVAKGNLSVEAEVDAEDEVGRTARSLNEALRQVESAMREVSRTAQELGNSSQQLASSANEISSGAQRQASSLEQTSASLEQMTANVRQSADSAQEACRVAESARGVAQKGGSVVGRAVQAMSEIHESSRKIAEIITTIDEIAFQTNLLALNAAVEAARAGEQGKGFAVVASEVRNLALRSAKAAKEIKALIDDSVRRVDNGTALVNESGASLTGIVSAVERVTQIVKEMANGTREQSIGIEQVSQAVSEMDKVTQTNAAQTEELSAAAETLKEQARMLTQLMSQFEVRGEREPAFAGSASRSDSEI